MSEKMELTEFGSLWSAARPGSAAAMQRRETMRARFIRSAVGTQFLPRPAGILDVRELDAFVDDVEGDLATDRGEAEARLGIGEIRHLPVGAVADELLDAHPVLRHENVLLQRLETAVVLELVAAVV